MTITLDLPEDVARNLALRSEDPARAALEALALEGYRTRTLSEEQIRSLLHLETRMEVHEFLKDHGVFLNYTADDLRDDLAKPPADGR